MVMTRTVMTSEYFRRDAHACRAPKLLKLLLLLSEVYEGFA